MGHFSLGHADAQKVQVYTLVILATVLKIVSIDH